MEHLVPYGALFLDRSRHVCGDLRAVRPDVSRVAAHDSRTGTVTCHRQVTEELQRLVGVGEFLRWLVRLNFGATDFRCHQQQATGPFSEADGVTDVGALDGPDEPTATPQARSPPMKVKAAMNK
ncbi:hypothetical protein [Streptomyces sp. NBC_00203]|uniref:hypothetical protein n=1 Tax=Streptomyces sp. NBC_00203 TaxID=2975680 RepID=UPI003251DA31